MDGKHEGVQPLGKAGASGEAKTTRHVNAWVLCAWMLIAAGIGEEIPGSISTDNKDNIMY